MTAEERDFDLDHDRYRRTGIAEAVYAPGKSPEQCATAVEGLLRAGPGPVLLTRSDADQVAATSAVNGVGLLTATGRDPRSGQALHLVAWRPLAPRTGAVCIAVAGTADLPVAHETQATLAAYGIDALLVPDVGVAGLHRVLARRADLRTADVVIVIAGMEGALASVAAGLTRAPVVAVPTSTGYGSAMDGITALLAMHASCSPGIVVVGIDNGFGAGCAAIRMLGPAEGQRA